MGTDREAMRKALEALRSARIMHTADQHEVVCLPPEQFESLRTALAAPEAPAAQVDEIALAAAQEIALMWGRDRSQFVAKIQVAVRAAIDSAISGWKETAHAD